MKRAISLLTLIALIFFLVQWGSGFFKDGHEIEYDITVNNQKFIINEKYEKELDDTYYLEIKHENFVFGYTVSNTFNKQKGILKNIEVYQKDNLFCIYPVFNQETESNIECSLNNKLYSYEALKTNSDVINFVSTLKQKGYKTTAWEEISLETRTSTSSTVYKDNLLEEDIITVWNYKGLDTISKDNDKYYSLYNYDKYENTHGYLVDKYYIVPNYQNNRVFDFNELTIINIETNNKETMTLKETLHQDTYINGVVNNKLYYFDKDNLIQVEIDPNKKHERTVGDINSNAQFYNGKWETINIYDLVNNKKQFGVDYSNNSELTKYNPTKVLESGSSYYCLTNDGSFYELSKRNLNNPILLWNQSSVKDIKLKNDTVYFVIGDTLYFYKESYGIRPILKNSELNYNYNNIIDIYKKSN